MCCLRLMFRMFTEHSMLTTERFVIELRDKTFYRYLFEIECCTGTFYVWDRTFYVWDRTFYVRDSIFYRCMFRTFYALWPPHYIPWEKAIRTVMAILTAYLQYRPILVVHLQSCIHVLWSTTVPNSRNCSRPSKWHRPIFSWVYK